MIVSMTTLVTPARCRALMASPAFARTESPTANTPRTSPAREQRIVARRQVSQKMTALATAIPQTRRGKRTFRSASRATGRPPFPLDHARSATLQARSSRATSVQIARSRSRFCLPLRLAPFPFPSFASTLVPLRKRLTLARRTGGPRLGNAKVKLQLASAICILPLVKWLNRVVAAALLVLWIPATSLCLLEIAGWLSNDGCCPSGSAGSPGSEPSDESPCCLLASGSYKANDEERAIAPTPLVAFLSVLNFFEPAERTDEPQRNGFEPSPPELLAGWQFSSRAALPPRAPSFVS